MMLAEIDGVQISEVIPQNDGSLVTTLWDRAGNAVGTVTRSSDGSALADVQAESTDSGPIDWESILKRATDFLDAVASSAQATSEQVTRVSRAVKGAATGAQAGYSAPINWKPYAIAAGAIVIAVAIVASSSSSRR